MIEEDIIHLFKNKAAFSNGCIGIGDDCAVIKKDDKCSFLISSDNLVEGTHFILDKISSADLAYKAIAVNISDIAAMGGVPKYIFFSVAIPNKRISNEWIRDFVNALQSTCDEYKITILGGDTTRSNSDLFLSITIIGEAQSHKIKFRNTAQIGDVICITGHTGLSCAGLRSIFSNRLNKSVVQYHTKPYPYVQEGIFLAEFKAVHAMMDISDGLDQDLRKICQASGCSAEVCVENIPVHDKLKNYSIKNALDLEELIISGGEDYILLFTVNYRYFKKLQKAYADRFSQKIFQIGRIIQQENRLIQYKKNNEAYSPNLNNFNHFWE